MNRGISTVVGLILVVIIATVLLSSIYVIMNSYQELFETSEARGKFLVEKRSEDLTITDAELSFNNTLVLKIKNTGSVTLKIITIWVNNTYKDLINSNVILTPGETTTIDTNCTIEVDKEYIVKLVTERGNIFTTFIPITGAAAKWDNEENAPETISPGSVTVLDEADEGSYYIRTYNPSIYEVLYGEYVSGSLDDLELDDSTYMIFKSYPYSYSSVLYAHNDTWNIADTNYHMLKTSPADYQGVFLSTRISSNGWHLLGSFVYPLNNTSISSDTWKFYYRGYYTLADGSIWSYRKQIIIRERSGHTLKNYQVLIVLTPDNFDYSKAKKDGSDIRFADSDGVTLLKYWIETWEYRGESKIWVKVPEIPANGEKIIYMYYGNPDASSLSSLTDVMESLPANDGSGYVIYYQEWVMPTSGLIGGGTRKYWRADDRQWRYRLPFNFPYYKSNYKYIAVASNGYININGNNGWSDYRDSTSKMKRRKYICPLWEDLMTNYPSNADIYIKTDYSDDYGSGVVVRWLGCFYYHYGKVNFEVVLYSNGLIRINYGYIDGRSYDRPTVGVSYGDNKHYTVSSYNDKYADWYNNRNSLMFWPRKKASQEPEVTVGSQEDTLPIAKFGIDIYIIASDGSIVSKIAEKVAEVDAPRDEIATVYGQYNIDDYTPGPNEYLLIKYHIYIFAFGDYVINAQLEIDNKDTPVDQQTRIVAINTTPFPTKYLVKVEFTGYAELTPNWVEVTWTTDSAYTFNNVSVILQLYNYDEGSYPSSGNGYISFVYNSYPEDVTRFQIISQQPSAFRNSDNGEWKILFTAYKTTDFNMASFKAKLDWMEYKVKGYIPPPPAPYVHYIYIGIANTSHFYRYDPTTGEYLNLTYLMPPGFIWHEGSAAVYIPPLDKLFFENTTHLFEFNVNLTGPPEIVAQLPVIAKRGASLVYLNANCIVYLPGEGYNSAWLFNTNSSEWIRLPNTPETLTKYSCAVGDGNGNVYLAIGGSSDGFYVYRASRNEWIKLEPLPASLITGLTYYNDRLYLSDAGGGLYEYIIQENTWYPLTPKIPISSLYYGCRLTCDGRNLYYIRMDYTREIYSISLICLSRNV